MDWRVWGAVGWRVTGVRLKVFWNTGVLCTQDGSTLHTAKTVHACSYGSSTVPTTCPCLFRVCTSRNWAQKQTNSMPWMVICNWSDSAKILIGCTCCHFPGHSLERCLWLSIQGSSFFLLMCPELGKKGFSLQNASCKGCKSNTQSNTKKPSIAETTHSTCSLPWKPTPLPGAMTMQTLKEFYNLVSTLSTLSQHLV